LTQLNSHGYVLPYIVHEQQTASARNLGGLQFWANTVGMKVVEPFISDQKLSFESIVKGVSNPMRFSDIYDIDYWNEQTVKRNCSELVYWENFLSNAPKSVILVIDHEFHPKTMNTSITGIVKTVNNPDAIVGRRRCDNYSGIEFPSSALTYFKQNGFHFVRQVCITYGSRQMTAEEYTKHILGHFSSNQVTVIFAFWLGIAKDRVNLKVIKSPDGGRIVKIGLLPSKKVVQDSQHYLQKLNFNNKNSNKYFGVMVRIERIFRNFVSSKKEGSLDIFVNYMLKCAADLKNLKQLKVHKNWGRTLAIDLGRLGSSTFKGFKDKRTDHGIKRMYDAYFSSIFGNGSWTIEEFEDSFKKYLGIDNPIYIAQIQRTVAAMSDCLILVGGRSSFQGVAVSFYENFHPDLKEPCIIKHCYFGK